MQFETHIDALLAGPRAQEGAVGYVHSAPIELILAAGVEPLRLIARPRPTPRADELLENSFSPECKSVAESYLSGELDALRAVIFPRYDDSAQRLYYYICELQRRKRCGGPKPLLFDVARIARRASFDYTLKGLKRLAKDLNVDLDRLGESIARVRSRNALLGELRAAKILGHLRYCIERAAELDWSHEFDAALRAWLSSARPWKADRSIVLAGSAPPSDELHREVESAGGNIVSECVRPITQTAAEAPLAESALEELARHYQRFVTPAEQLLRAPNWLVDVAQSYDAHGVILWLIEEDEASPWEVPLQIASLQAARMPLLVLPRERWPLSNDTRQRIRTFVQSLNAARGSA